MKVHHKVNYADILKMRINLLEVWQSRRSNWTQDHWSYTTQKTGKHQHN